MNKLAELAEVCNQHAEGLISTTELVFALHEAGVGLCRDNGKSYDLYIGSPDHTHYRLTLVVCKPIGKD